MGFAIQMVPGGGRKHSGAMVTDDNAARDHLGANTATSGSIRHGLAQVHGQGLDAVDDGELAEGEFLRVDGQAHRREAAHQRGVGGA